MSDILGVLEERARRGEELSGLDLHIRAMKSAKDGDLEASADAFVAAQEWESANGYARAALHTSHQRALLTNFGGDLDRLSRYYQETVRTLKRLQNREGMALCLRSIGELALIAGRYDEMTKAWELAGRLFTKLALPESRQIGVWLAATRDGLH